MFQWIRANKILLVNSGTLVGTTAVTSTLGFIYWWFAARQFTPQVVGLASAAISAMALLGTFSILGLGTLLLGELPRLQGKEFSLINAALILAGGVAGFLGIMLAVYASYLSTDLRILGDSIENVALFAVGVSLTAITLILDDAFTGLLRSDLQLWRNTLFAVVKLAALFGVSLWVSHITGLTIYATWIFGNVFSLVVLAGFFLLKKEQPGRSYLPQWGLLRKLGPAALKHHALNMTLQAPSLILPILVTVLLSATVNAWFYVAWSLASISNVITAAFARILYTVSSAQPSELTHRLRLTLSLALTVCILINCVLLLGTKEVLGIFGHSYSEQAAWSLRILSLESFPFIARSHYIALSRIHGQITRTTLLTIASGLLELCGAALGGYLGGLTGLSLGWLTAMCIEAIFMARRVYNDARYVKSALQFPSIPSSMGEQAIWLIDTLVLAAIRPAMVGTGTDFDQKQVLRNPNNSRPCLRAIRLVPYYEYSEQKHMPIAFQYLPTDVQRSISLPYPPGAFSSPIQKAGKFTTDVPNQQ